MSTYIRSFPEFNTEVIRSDSERAKQIADLEISKYKVELEKCKKRIMQLTKKRVELEDANEELKKQNANLNDRIRIVLGEYQLNGERAASAMSDYKNR